MKPKVNIYWTKSCSRIQPAHRPSNWIARRRVVFLEPLGGAVGSRCCNHPRAASALWHFVFPALLGGGGGSDHRTDGPKSSYEFRCCNKKSHHSTSCKASNVL